MPKEEFFCPIPISTMSTNTAAAYQVTYPEHGSGDTTGRHLKIYSEPHADDSDDGDWEAERPYLPVNMQRIVKRKDARRAFFERVFRDAMKYKTSGEPIGPFGATGPQSVDEAEAYVAWIEKKRTEPPAFDGEGILTNPPDRIMHGRSERLDRIVRLMMMSASNERPGMSHGFGTASFGPGTAEEAATIIQTKTPSDFSTHACIYRVLPDHIRRERDVFHAAMEGTGGHAIRHAPQDSDLSAERLAQDIVKGDIGNWILRDEHGLPEKARRSIYIQSTKNVLRKKAEIAEKARRQVQPS
jgi:hypothetical protein